MTLRYFILAATSVLLIECSNPEQNIATKPLETPIKDSYAGNDSSNVKMDTSMKSEITCPQCGFKKTETMPTDVCLIKYNCEKCRTELRPKQGDCCVFCTYGTKKCPSMQ